MGKTTLLSIIGCVLRPDTGRVTILDMDVTQLSPDSAAILRRDFIGFVFQRFHLIRGLNALENVCVPLMLRGKLTPADRQRCQHLLETVGLADKQRSQPRELSVGQCQRVALARALANDPDVILADEPTASLDAENGQVAMEMLRRLTVETNRTAIVVTHDRRIFSFADRILELESGRIANTAIPITDSPQYAAHSTVGTVCEA